MDAPEIKYAGAMLKCVNKERAKQGLPPLRMSRKLCAAAERHVTDQATKCFMSHKGSDGSMMAQRVTESGFTWTTVAENLAAGQTSVSAVMDSWMKSPGHRSNILGSHTMFGVAYAYNPKSKFKHHWTQVFGTTSIDECSGPSYSKTNSVSNEGDDDPTSLEVPVEATGCSWFWFCR